MIILFELYIWLVLQSPIHLPLLLLRHNTHLQQLQHYLCLGCQSPFWIQQIDAGLSFSKSSAC